MGLIGDAINWVKEKIFGKSQPEPAKTNDVTNGSGGGYSSAPSHIYNYEPDKLRIAEIERQTKLELADKETERIELMRDATIELLKAQAVTQAAIEKARAEGMREMTQQLIDLQKEMLEVAEKRIVIIEKCALPIIRDIENFYNQIGEKFSKMATIIIQKSCRNCWKLSISTKKVLPPLKFTPRRLMKIV